MTRVLSRRHLGLALVAASCARRGCGPEERVAELPGNVEALHVSGGIAAVVGGGARGRMWTIEDGKVIERVDRLEQPRDVLFVHDHWVVASDGGVVALPGTGAGRVTWSERPAWRLGAGAALCWIERETSAIWRRGEDGPIRITNGPAAFASGFCVIGSRALWTADDRLFAVELAEGTPRELAHIDGAGDVVALDHRLFAVATPDGVVRHPDGGRIIDARAPASLSSADGWLAFAEVGAVAAVGSKGVVRVSADAQAVATDGRGIWWVDRDDVLWRRMLSS